MRIIIVSEEEDTTMTIFGTAICIHTKTDLKLILHPTLLYYKAPNSGGRGACFCDKYDNEIWSYMYMYMYMYMVYM